MTLGTRCHMLGPGWAVRRMTILNDDGVSVKTSVKTCGTRARLALPAGVILLAASRDDLLQVSLRKAEVWG